MDNVREWATKYRGRGWAICRIEPGQKRPSYKDWNRHTLEPDDFGTGDGIGIQAGALSGNLVCVDLDHPDALELADQHLPPTGMVEGRPGKPGSHRWYVVTDVPPEAIAQPKVAGGIGGPRIRRFKRPDGEALIDFQGTGSQAVVPPSVWTSKDGSRTEVRRWENFGEPAVLRFDQLWTAVCALATACGWVDTKAVWRPDSKANKPRAKAEPPKAVVVMPEPARLPIPPGEAARQARSYLAKVDAAVEGQGGDSKTWTVACRLVIDFGLTPEKALPLILEYNSRCQPPWSVEKLKHKLAEADKLDRADRGLLVRPTSRAVLVNVARDDSVIHVGVDAACAGGSYVDLSPSLYTGIVKVGQRRRLAPELAIMDWVGRRVVLTPPSTVETNKQEVWGEFFLADLLREAGADVVSLHLPPLEGRLRTLAQADGAGVLVVPPRIPSEAHHAAEKASDEARRLDAYRRSLPRQKASPKLDKALAFLAEHGVQRLTKDIVHLAKENGLSKDTLRRALNRKELTCERDNTLPNNTQQPSSSSSLCEAYPSMCA